MAGHHGIPALCRVDDGPAYLLHGRRDTARRRRPPGPGPSYRRPRTSPDRTSTATAWLETRPDPPRPWSGVTVQWRRGPNVWLPSGTDIVTEDDTSMTVSPIVPA